MMTRVNDLSPAVMMSLKGCPEETAMYGIRRAISAICRETGCWRGIISFVAGTVAEDDGNKEIEIPDSANVADATIFRISSVSITKAGETEKQSVPISSCSVYRGERNLISFASHVDVEEGDAVSIVAHLYPSEIGSLLTDFPINVLHQCADCAIHLATSIVASMPERVWSSPMVAQASQYEYRRAKRNLLFELQREEMDTYADSRMVGLVEG
jgi:hypothetical protein